MRRNAKEERKRRFVRLDHYFEKPRVTGKDVKIRRKFGIPDSGFKNVEELHIWEEKFFENKEDSEKWRATIKQIASWIELPKEYFHNLEMYIQLNFNGAYQMNQEGLSRKRIEDNYLRNKAIFSISKIVDSKTGKKLKADEVARRFQPGFDEAGNMWPADMYEQIMKNFSGRKEDKWHNKYGFHEKKDPGAAVRKIISRHKKNFS